jgi:hypothetical protein
VNAGLILNSWYNALKDVVNVYLIDVPETEESDYVLLYLESGSGLNLKGTKVDEVYVVCQVVTFHVNNIDQTSCEAIDAIVENAVLPTAFAQVITASGVQVLNIERESFDYVVEEDQSRKIYRKVSRYKHRVHQ